MPTGEELARLRVLAGLPTDHLDRLAALAATARYPVGHRLFREGQPADRCWLLTAGRVALDTLVPNEGLVVLHTLGPGDLVGWSWLMSPYRWHFGARTQTTVTGYVLDAGRLRDLADAEPEFGYPLALRFCGVLIDRLQLTRVRLLDAYRGPCGNHDRTRSNR
jgi:CRP-like cAMP-binding protein